jgi:acyl-coenzyme A synthetase/AMP-(fatty) acid ligase
VLGPHLELLPVGVIGELYVAGAGLARGYQGDPAGTAARFVADPFGTPGERMYRTGDLARWDEQGLLWFEGRADAQVKLRGHRIEPAEVEAALLRHRQVGAAAVVVREDRPGDARLVGYVVQDPATAAEPLDEAAVRDELAAELPHYLVPAAVVRLDALPLTANGKLDRAGLPAPSRPARASTPPRSAREAMLCQLFSETVGTEIGPRDDFLDWWPRPAPCWAWTSRSAR